MRCLSQVEGHKGDVQGLMKVTSYGDSPDIHFLTFSEGEAFFSGVDEGGLHSIKLDRPVHLVKDCNSPAQILHGQPTGAFSFIVLEQAAEGHLLSLWRAASN